MKLYFLNVTSLGCCLLRTEHSSTIVYIYIYTCRRHVVDHTGLRSFPFRCLFLIRLEQMGNFFKPFFFFYIPTEKHPITVISRLSGCHITPPGNYLLRMKQRLFIIGAHAKFTFSPVRVDIVLANLSFTLSNAVILLSHHRVNIGALRSEQILIGGDI